MRISAWSSDVCSSDLGHNTPGGRSGRRSKDRGPRILRDRPVPAQASDQKINHLRPLGPVGRGYAPDTGCKAVARYSGSRPGAKSVGDVAPTYTFPAPTIPWERLQPRAFARSEEHTSELQSLMRISYAVFCLKK